MGGWRVRLARVAVFLFTRVLCPPFLLAGGVDGYAACLVRGMRVAARLVPCGCEEISLLVQALTVSSLLYASLVSRILGVERSAVIKATASAWRAVLELTLGSASGADGESNQPTMFT